MLKKFSIIVFILISITLIFMSTQKKLVPVEALIITKGSQGSIIYTDQEISIAPVKVDAPIDPTGCGDAYRAGLVYGIDNELSTGHGFKHLWQTVQ